MRNNSLKQPAVSVVVPAYNVGPYIDKCLRSLVSQSLDSLQIIVVDDGSTDDTPERIRAIQEREGAHIEVIRQPNAGLSAARNTGIAAATGQFIGFVDADDWVSPRMFEKLYDRAVETNSEVVVCAALKRWSGGGRKRVRLRIPLAEYGTSVRENPEILWGGHSYAWNKIYSRELINRESFRFPDGKLFEDSAVVYGLIARANRVEAVDEGLYQYRMGRVGAITQTADPRVFHIFDSCDSMRELLAFLNGVEGMDNVVERLIRTHLFARLPTVRWSRSPILSMRFTFKAHRYLDEHCPGWRDRYHQGQQSSLRYLSRRNTPTALLVSFVAPMRNVFRTILEPVRRAFWKYLAPPYYVLRSAIGRRVGALRRTVIAARATRKLDRAMVHESIPYTLDLESLLAAHAGRRLASPIQVAILPNNRAVADIIVAMRQQGLQLVRSNVYDEKCTAQLWRLRSRLFGIAKVEVRFLEPSSAGSLRTWFFYSDESPEPVNSRRVVRLTTVQPKNIARQKIRLAGTASVAGADDPFCTTRTTPDLLPPRKIRSLAESRADIEVLEEKGFVFHGMPPAPTATVEQARSEQMGILSQLLDFCAERSLRPFLADGSLLGAVRHEGYIPWDDDIDLWMMRSEFEELVASELPEGLAVLHFTTNDRYHLGFAKIVRLGSAFEWSYPRDLHPAGANIDIFPLDWSASPDGIAERIRGRLVRFLRQVIRAKYRFPESRRRWGRRLLSRLLPGTAWHRILRALVVCPPLGKKSNLTSWFSGHPAKRASYPATWIAPAGELQFEGMPVAVPRDPPRVLTRTYGDFMELPVPAKRTSPNHFLKLRASE